MIAALIVVGVVMAVLAVVIIRDERSFGRGYNAGYNTGWEDHYRLERARARVGLGEIGVKMPECPRGPGCLWPACVGRSEDWTLCAAGRETSR